MADTRRLELFLLRYVPNPIANEFVNIGLVLLEPSQLGRSVVDVRFTSNWDSIREFDPDADTELLSALAVEISGQLKTGNPGEMLQRMDDSFSNAIQLSSCVEYYSTDPVKEIETLATKYLQ